MRWRQSCILALALLTATAAWGERDYAVIRAAPGATARITHRLALIGWNGQEELMIFATGFSADGDATVLQALPLPGLPSQITAAPRESLRAVQDMAADRDAGGFLHGTDGTPVRSGAGLPAQVPSFDEASARDRRAITPVDADGFLAEAAAFATRQGGRLTAEDASGLRAMAARYLRGGCRHFVLEAVDLHRGLHLVGPTSYRFASDTLFFAVPPTAPGALPHDLRVFLLTRPESDPQALPLGLRLSPREDDTPTLWFPVSRADVLRASAVLGALLPDPDGALLTAMARSTSGRARDLVLRAQPPPAARPAAASQPPPATGGRTRTMPSPPDHLPKASTVHGLAWSPSGDRLCVLAAHHRPLKTATLFDLANGSGRELVLAGWLSPQAWSPDGKQLAFLNEWGNIEITDVDRNRARQSTEFPNDGSWGGGDLRSGWSPPAWSPSGEWLAFGAFYDVWLVRPDGRDLRPLTHTEWEEPSPETGAESGTGGRGWRPAARSAGGIVPTAMGGGRGGGGGRMGGRGAVAPPPRHYAWSPDGRVLAYGQGTPDGADWSAQGYDAATAVPTSVRGDLHLKGIRSLAWQPGGDQLAVVGVGPMTKQLIYLLPRQGAIRELSTDLTSVEAFWTGDGRALLLRGGVSGTHRLTVRAIDAARGTMRTLPPTHFLADQEVTLVAPRPGSDEIAFAVGASVYLAHADGSGWRRLQRTGRVALHDMTNPLERWSRDPVVVEAARRWRHAAPQAGDEPRALLFGIWDDVLAHWPSRPDTGPAVPYRDLPEALQRKVLTGLVYQTLYRTAPYDDPAALRVPEWYWWLDEARVGFGRPFPSALLFLVDGPEDADYAFVISPPDGSERPVHRKIPWHLWWPTLSGLAAVVVAVVGWRQRRRERAHSPAAAGPPSVG